MRKKITNFQCNSENKKYQAMAVFKRVAQRRPVLNFSCVDKNFVIKEIRNLDINEAKRDIDIPVRILKKVHISR